MRPFDDGQSAIFQQLLNEYYSKTGKVDGGEDMMRDILAEVFSENPKSKKNFMFWDYRTDERGIELKKHETQNNDPLSYCGKLVGLQFTRTIKNIPLNSIPDTIAYICEHYMASRAEFKNACTDACMGVSLVGRDRLVYFHMDVPTLDASELEGRWGEETTKGTRNLYVTNKATGDLVFTYLPNGNKLHLAVRMPPVDEVHAFDAKKVVNYPRTNDTETSILELARRIGTAKSLAILAQHEPVQ